MFRANLAKMASISALILSLLYVVFVSAANGTDDSFKQSSGSTNNVILQRSPLRLNLAAAKDVRLPLVFKSDTLTFTARRPDNNCLTGINGDNLVEYVMSNCQMQLGWANTMISLTAHDNFQTVKSVTIGMSTSGTNVTYTNYKSKQTDENKRTNERVTHGCKLNAKDIGEGRFALNFSATVEKRRCLNMEIEFSPDVEYKELTADGRYPSLSDGVESAFAGLASGIKENLVSFFGGGVQRSLTVIIVLLIVLIILIVVHFIGTVYFIKRTHGAKPDGAVLTKPSDCKIHRNLTSNQSNKSRVDVSQTHTAIPMRDETTVPVSSTLDVDVGEKSAPAGQTLKSFLRHAEELKVDHRAPNL